MKKIILCLLPLAGLATACGGEGSAAEPVDLPQAPFRAGNGELQPAQGPAAPIQGQTVDGQCKQQCNGDRGCEKTCQCAADHPGDDCANCLCVLDNNTTACAQFCPTP